jgi:hypothetical protein
MTRDLKKQVELVDLNLKVIIAFSFLIIASILMYIAFFK